MWPGWPWSLGRTEHGGQRDRRGLLTGRSGSGGDARCRHGAVGSRTATSSRTRLPRVCQMRNADAALSIDALQLMPDRAAVLGEVHRILRTRARFALTTWEAPTSDAGASENANHQPLRALLLEAGFSVELYEPTPAWRRIAQAIYTGWLREKDSLVAEMGAKAYAPLEKEATESLPKMLEDDERVLIVSRAI
jgi:hypothetical protein